MFHVKAFFVIIVSDVILTIFIRNYVKDWEMFIMIFIGIDPGLNGAIAFFDRDKGTLFIYDMPTVEVVRNNKQKKEISAQLTVSMFTTFMSEFFSLSKNNITAILERVGGMPGQGVSSVFSFGRSVGIIEGILASYEIQTTIVSPQKWQKKVNVRGGKDGNRQRAVELFPAYAHYFTLKKHDGRADAALMSWYGATL